MAAGCPSAFYKDDRKRFRIIYIPIDKKFVLQERRFLWWKDLSSYTAISRGFDEGVIVGEFEKMVREIKRNEALRAMSIEVIKEFN